MQTKLKIFIFALIGILAIVFIIWGAYWLLTNAQKMRLNTKTSGSLTNLPVLTTTPAVLGDNISLTPAPSPVINQNVKPTGLKTYQGKGFSFTYPQNWGLLTCSDSENIELDPESSTDLKNYSCNRAIKPVTILVNKNGNLCSGENSKKLTANFLSYHWCKNVGGISFDISHRVNFSGGTGVSKTDYSKEVEKIINTIQLSSSGS